MRKTNKVISILIYLFILILGILIIYGLTSTTFIGETYDNQYTINSEYTNINISAKSCIITVNHSENDKTVVKLKEREKIYHEVLVNGNTLNITQVNNLNLFERIFGYNGLEVNIYLPSDTYEDFSIDAATSDITFNTSLSLTNLNIVVSTGDTNIKDINISNKLIISGSTGDDSLENVSAKSISITRSTGDMRLTNVTSQSSLDIEGSTSQITLDNVTSKTLTINRSTGDVELSGVVIENSMTIEGTTGDSEFINCDASTIRVTQSTGHISGNFLTNKTFHTQTKTGTINVPETTGNDCYLKTTTGNINITIGHK